ncbi:porin [Aquabacterium sp. J223]|uniref:porin n=1 Tax=Aquabacterium sp. J223 TaxID=2898431 RepID=UPI0021ADEBB5|nr:porin [Aquabacterium sp. J223]UUX93981.1 porin [Aquabacterium sp. J223]
MKKPFALACLAAMTSAASAQSSVNVTGILDSAARQVRNTGTGSVASLVSGSNATSRLAFIGKEDLGGGLSAGFHLEHGVLVDSGSQVDANKFWDRRSTVSLVSTGMGELRLGRDFVPSYVSWSRFDPFSYVGVARSASFFSAGVAGAPNPVRSTFGTNGNTLVRSDNAVQYLLPSLAGLPGLEGALMVAAGEGGAVASGNAKLMGGRLGWSSGPVSLSAAYTTSENAQTTAGKFKDGTVGGSYQWQNVRLAAAWRRLDQAAARQTLTMLAASAVFGPHEVKGSWVRNDLSGRVGATAIGANDASQLGLGYVYNLSPRTALYATAARITNDAAAAYAIAGTVTAGGRSSGYEAGLRHRF